MGFMNDKVFRNVERIFHNYAEDCRYLESLEERKNALPIVKSSSNFSERVDLGNGYSDPVSTWFEKVEFFEEQILRCRMKVIPVGKMLEYLHESEPEMYDLFHWYYIKKLKWYAVEAEMGISEKVRRRLRKALVMKGVRFIGLPIEE